MHFTKLFLAGFKSFVEPTDVPIHPGLTGIVGPNGCGKSNLVEALRWVMGETSAKRMRGGDMDDVIFGGTSARPMRNVAEVVLHVDNQTRGAPVAYNDNDELEIRRKIERGNGSDYSVNGKHARAKDVQTLFADTASGASSPALVSQGKIGALVNAKPTERRMILEEAAGVAGLRARRHEAELKLKAADANLLRVDDVLGNLESQSANLKKQARQAARYRSFSDLIRKAEGLYLHLSAQAANEKLASIKETIGALDTRLAIIAEDVARHTNRDAALSEQLPELRKAQAEKSAALQRLAIARDQITREEEQLKAQMDAARGAAEQIARDQGREQQLASEATQHLEQLKNDREALRASGQSHDAELQSAEHQKTQARAAVQAAETELDAAAQARASLSAQLQNLQRQKQQAEARLSNLQRQRDEWLRKQHDLESRIAHAGMDEAATKADQAAAARDAAQASLADAEAARTAQASDIQTARTTFDEARHEFSRWDAEHGALQKILQQSNAKEFAPVVDSVTVEKGYEAALAAALGDGLEAALDHTAPVHWNALGVVTITLPEGAKRLSDVTNAPDALQRALSAIGLVESEQDGTRLQSQLQPGSSLVTREGALWRWDGFTVSSKAMSASAVRLQQRNRLNDLQAAGATIRTALEQAQSVYQEKQTSLSTAENAEREARQTYQAAARNLETARQEQASLLRRHADQNAELASLQSALERARSDEEEAKEQIANLDESLAQLPAMDVAEARAQAAQAQMQSSRSALQTAESSYNQLQMQAADRQRRLEQNARDEQAWQARQSSATDRLQELSARATQTETQIQELSGQPAALQAKRHELASHISQAEQILRGASDELAAMENQQRAAAQDLRASEQQMAASREERVRLESADEIARHQLQELSERSLNAINVALKDLPEALELTDAEKTQDAEQVQRRFERLVKERDTMGPVNLRAELEEAELQTQIDTLTSERDELMEAINKLRGGIGHLNREARERLLAAFETVNKHFQELFTKLFNGGSAELQLIESDDPLEAGLEIIASPPGKKLQSMTLMSGGEQALTALSLIFAMFKANPAPICVLDEVDAPLDDANVDRFCTLLDVMAEENKTRFLVITHHRLTMARMHRLYGVTMMEPGVSRLVSVDLDTAAELAERIAA